MSVETRRYRMPQPEQWLSEHDPWATLAIIVGVPVLACLIGWLT